MLDQLPGTFQSIHELLLLSISDRLLILGLRLLLWNQGSTIILKFEDLRHKIGKIVVGLQKRVQITGIADVLDTARHSIFPLALLGIQRLVRV